MTQENPANPRTKADKSMIQKHMAALRRFNEWEAGRTDKMPDHQGLAAVFELYEMIPEAARQRPVDAQGIIKMHKALACLK